LRTSVIAVALAAAGLTLAGCGGGGGSPTIGPIPKAKVFSLQGFEPSAPVTPGKQTNVTFTIQQPDGKPLTTYAVNNGPHSGVHLIIVRDDLAGIIHQHPKPDPKTGKVTQPVTFPAPGRYHVVVDAYPDISPPLRNFQLTKTIDVKGRAPAIVLPPFRATQKVDGYTLTMQGKPKLKAIEPAFMTIKVTDPKGKPAHFTPYFGALAHAIFFRQGSLDYFHTHVCAPGATGCTAILGASKITGTSTTPGVLRVGVLVPVPGTWRLFLQTEVAGDVLTAPYTLKVGA
jgi:hypothetical protein